MRHDVSPLVTIAFRHTWIFFILIQCVNGAVWGYKAQPRIAENPRTGPGYRRLIRSWFIYGNVPWVVMGAGIIFGGIPSVFHYFNPRNGAYVIAFWLSVTVLWVALIYWIFFRGGAEDLIEHPGLLNIPVQKPWIVKLFVLAAIAGGVVAMIAMIFLDIQIPALP